LALVRYLFIFYKSIIFVDHHFVQAGKTYIANAVSEAVENADTEYRATQGVRILEYEPPCTIANKIEVELWDCSGDPK
jgi:hypothetical protein